VTLDSSRTGVRLTGSGRVKLVAPLLTISPVGFAVGASGVQIDRFEITGYAECGIAVAADNARIQGNTVHHNAVNICVTGSTGTLVSNNVVDHSAGDGIDVTDGGANRIANNRISISGEFGIFVQNSPIEIDHNSMFGNAIAGIAIQDTTGASIENNTLRFGEGFGIFTFHSADIDVVMNSVQNHGLVGIAVDSCVADARGCTVVRNTVTGSNLSGVTSFLGGISLSDSDGASIVQNSAHRNGLVDCVWDGNGSNDFRRNACGVEEPAGAWD
jgi:parallel beta-helix repeat protein